MKVSNHNIIGEFDVLGYAYDESLWALPNEKEDTKLEEIKQVTSGRL
jgi:hypothetical protein